MKKLITIATMFVSLCSFGLVTQYDLVCGTNGTNYVKIPGGSAQIVGFETAMTDASEAGSAALSIERPITGHIIHTDYQTHTTTSVVAEADTLVNHYDITATFNVDGMNNWVQNSIFSNCYANTTNTGKYANTNKTSRIVFRPGDGTKTLVPPTDFYVGLTFFEDNRWSTNFTWAANQSEIIFDSGTQHPSYIVSIKRQVPPLKSVKVVTNVVTTVSTNIWNEKVNRLVTIPIIGSTVLTNGYLLTRPPSDFYTFAGDRFICTAPIADNKAGVARVYLKQ